MSTSLFNSIYSHERIFLFHPLQRINLEKRNKNKTKSEKGVCTPNLLLDHETNNSMKQKNSSKSACSQEIKISKKVNSLGTSPLCQDKKVKFQYSNPRCNKIKKILVYFINKSKKYIVLKYRTKKKNTFRPKFHSVIHFGCMQGAKFTK